MRRPHNESDGASLAKGSSRVSPEGKGLASPVRSCILTRSRASRGALVRIVLSPENMILPDVRAKAPGRGAWIGVTRAELEMAVANGKLRSALARAFKSSDFMIPSDLPALVATALEKNALDRLGLEARSGALITGSDKISEAARAGKLHALYHAADASPDGSRKLAQAWRVGSDREGSDLQGLALPAQRPILSLALGRENVVHIGVLDRMAAARLGEALTRWLHFIGSDPRPGHPQSNTLTGAQPAPCETASQSASAPRLSGRHRP